jgi:hypothetical protein
VLYHWPISAPIVNISGIIIPFNKHASAPKLWERHRFWIVHQMLRRFSVNCKPQLLNLYYWSKNWSLGDRLYTYVPTVSLFANLKCVQNPVLHISQSVCWKEWCRVAIRSEGWIAAQRGVHSWLDSCGQSRRIVSERTGANKKHCVPSGSGGVVRRRRANGDKRRFCVLRGYRSVKKGQ